MKLSIFLFILLIGTMLNAQVVFVAHRGESFLAPENTVAAANIAWSLNDEAVEIDVHMSADNRLMVIHDGNTFRTSGQKYVISESKAEDLRKLDVGSFKDQKFKGEKIPFLEEVITTLPKRKNLIIEIKASVDILPILKSIVQHSKKQKQLIFIAFDWNTIIRTKEIFPRNKCYWLSSNKMDILNKMNSKNDLMPDGFNLAFHTIDEEIMKRAKELNLDIWAWTVDDVTEARRLTELGVTGITSNRAAWLRDSISDQSK